MWIATGRPLDDGVSTSPSESVRFVHDTKRGATAHAANLYRGAVVPGTEVYDARGRAYPGVPDGARVSMRTRYLVVLKVADHEAPTRFPHEWLYHRAKTAGPVTFRSWREELFHLAAHEARHVVQFIEGLPCSEVDAEEWAHGSLRSWRERSGT